MSLKLNCYYPAEIPRIFDVVVESLHESIISSLVRSVQQTLLSDFKIEISRDDIQLFKTDIPFEPSDDLRSRALLWLHQKKGVGCLPEASLVSSAFQEKPSKYDIVHIIVSDLEIAEMSDNLGDSMFYQKKKLRKDLGERITSLCPSNSPSETAGSPAKIREVIEGNKSRVYVGRPGGAPAAIFNPALAALQLRLENLDQVKVDHGDVVNAAEYMDKAITAYDDESAREKAIKTCIDIAVGQSGDWNSRLDWADAIKPDCAWWHKLFLTIVLELRNIDGLAGNPSFQSIIDYCKIIPQKKYQEFHEFSNFPVVILGVAENRIDISIAVCVGEIHVSKLLTIDVTAGFLISANILRLARIFKALSLCREDLVRYYDHVEEKANTNIPLSCLYPQPTPLNDSVEMPNLTYTSFMTRDGQPTPALVSLGDLKFTAMYMATMHGIQNKVVVKFTPRYNRCAHELLAEAGFAPKLHFCAPVVGGLFMVVMDYVDGKSLSQLKSPIPAAIPEQVKEAVDLLHKKDIVFGDLRDPNILYSEALNQVFLVDFDWPGKHEGDRYPTALNLMHKWAAGVMRYGLMQKAHDLWQIERIEKLC